MAISNLDIAHFTLYVFQVQRLDRNFKGVLGRYGNDELPLKEMLAELMMDTTKDDLSILPGIYPPEFEYHLSAIYVEVTQPQVI